MGEAGDNHKKSFHIKDWREWDRPREMLSNIGGFHGLMSTTSADLLVVKDIGKEKGIKSIAKTLQTR
jgi:hypothetical protein